VRIDAVPHQEFPGRIGTALLGLALFFVLTAGLGLLLPPLHLNGRQSLGAAWVGGYALLVGGIFLFHVVARIPITILIWTLLVIAVLGAAKALLRGDLHWRTLVAHPCVVLCAFAALVILANGGIGYLPYTIDDFTNWLGASRLIYLSGGYEAVRDSIYLSGYTPGWRMMLTLPWFFAGSFDPGQSAAATMVLHAGVAGLFFDLVRYALDTRAANLHRHGDIAAWLALLVYLSVQASGALWPYTLLIEQPQIYAYTAIVMLLFTLNAAYEQSRSICIFLALSLLLAYLLKAVAILFLPGVALALFLIFRKHENKPDTMAAFKAIAFVLTPVLLGAILWGVLKPASDSCFSSPGMALSQAAFARAATYDWIDLLQRFTAAIWLYLATYKWPLSILAGAGIAMAAASGRMAMPVALAGFAFLYFAALYWFHLTCFGPYYFETLASVERFTRVVLQPAHAAGLLAFVVMVVLAVPGRTLENIMVRKSVFAVMALAMVVLFAWQSMNLQRNVADMTTRRHQNVDPRIAEVARAARFVGTQKDYAANPPLIQFISQGTDGDILGYATYYELTGRNGAPARLFTSAVSVSWTFNAPENPWQYVTDRADLINTFRKADIIWPVITAPWIDDILNDMADGGPCPAPLVTAVLIKRDTGGYDCRTKP